MLSRRQRLGILLATYPPYLGAGVAARRLPGHPPSYRARMGLHWWNRNLVGTQFGGSLFSMCDPFFMLILVECLGPSFVVWDKEATIRFRRPGRGAVEATFAIAAERVAEIEAAARREPKVEPVFTARVVDAEGAVVAEIDKTLHVRLAAAS